MQPATFRAATQNLDSLLGLVESSPIPAQRGMAAERGGLSGATNMDNGQAQIQGRIKEHLSPPPPPPPSPLGVRPFHRASRKSRPPKSSPPPSAQGTLGRKDYAPAVSSPLHRRADRNSLPRSSDGNDHEMEELVQRNSVTRRNLQIRVIDVPAEPSIPRRPNTAFSNASVEKSSDTRSNSTSTPLLKHKSTLSLQSLGQDYSRYPSQPPYKALAGSPVFSRPWAIHGHKPPRNPLTSNVSNGFDGEDPERGFSPYMERSSKSTQFPTIDEKEDDDIIHNPDPSDKLRLTLPGCNRRFCLMIICVSMIVIGILSLFIVWPVLTYAGIALESGEKKRGQSGEERLSNFTYPILGAVRKSLIDPDTPKSAKIRESVLGLGKLKLVFSDEFNKDGRTFYENDDQFWQAADLHYAATQDLEWYDPDAVTTKDGTLRLRLDAFRNHDLDYRSGMIQSWNKLCFKGGVLEVSASLPGPPGIPGLWPGIWTLGNLARPGYKSTSDGVWPYSYDQCDVGISPNQSSFDGISYLPGQKFAKCTCKGEDHPSPGTGRGAPEIDSLEGTADNRLGIGVATQSSQVAPFDIYYVPNYEFVAIKNYEVTQMNGWSGGPYQQAISGTTTLNNDWYDSNQFQKYAFEYIPGQADGEIAWFVGDEETFRLTGDAIGPNGNVGQRDVSREPMSIILNLGFSPAWTWIDWQSLGARLGEGTTMYIDYVRIYQEEGKESVGCDPPGYPTTKYIKNHLKAYENANLTLWKDTGYPWPKNTIVDNCL